MKSKTIKHNTLISLLISYLLMFVIISPVFAMKDDSMIMVYDNKTTDKEVIESIINSTVKLKSIRSSFDSLKDKIGVNKYRIDTSEYVLEYNVNKEFMRKFNKTDKSIEAVKKLISPYPTIYIPLFGEVNQKSRVIGHVKIKYDILDHGYEFRTSFRTNVNLPDFENNYHFYEILERNLEKEPDNCKFILIRFPSAYNDSTEKMALVFSDESINVIDFQNSAGSAVSKEQYTFDEYYSLRTEYEKELYKSNTTSDPSEWTFGGQAKNTISNSRQIIITSVMIVFVFALVFIVFLIKKKNRRNCEKTGDG